MKIKVYLRDGKVREFKDIEGFKMYFNSLINGMNSIENITKMFEMNVIIMVWWDYINTYIDEVKE